MNSAYRPKKQDEFANNRHRFSISLKSCLSFVAAILSSGCASVSVQQTAGAIPKKSVIKPQQIIVADFTIPQSSSIRVDRNKTELSEFEKKLVATLRQAMVKDLQPFGIPVKATESSCVEQLKKSRQRAWLITGQFTRVNQGSRALRIVFGLGAGGTKMETNAQIFDLSARGSGKIRPLSEFKTTGGSNAEPGAILSGGPDPISIGASVGLTAFTSGMHGVTEDTQRTARMIADYVSEELAACGVISEDHVKKAKHLGLKKGGS